MNYVEKIKECGNQVILNTFDNAPKYYFYDENNKIIYLENISDKTLKDNGIKIKKPSKRKYYSFKRLMEQYPDCQYYIIYGERSNGKSYSILELMVEEFYNSGYTHAFGYIRRVDEDIKLSNASQVFKSLKCNDDGVNRIEEITKGEYNDVFVKSRCFYLAHRNEEGELDNVLDSQPLGYLFALNQSERIKSTGYPDIYWIFFEEFIAENLPLLNEIDKLTSVLSTIIRNRNNVKIVMAGNTINKHNYIFKEYGLHKTKYQKPNTVDLYQYRDDMGTLKIACEFTDFPDKSVKKSNIYFCFNKEKNKMIREGMWQIGNYPHLQYLYKPKDIRFIYFIKYENEVFQCEVIQTIDNKENKIDNYPNDIYSNKPMLFTYIHKKTSEIKYPHDHIIFQQDYDSHDNIRTDIMNAYDEVGSFIKSFFATGKVFYQDNEVGDMIDSFLMNTRQRVGSRI